jgi:hypothetical protein
VNGFEVIELSEREYKGISKIMATLDEEQDNSFAYFSEKDNLIKWHFKTKGSEINDICIVYDITKDTFLVDNQKVMQAGVDHLGQGYIASELEPKIYKDDFGYDDEGQAIPWEYWTKAFDESMPTRKKEYWEARTDIAINELGEVTQEVYI